MLIFLNYNGSALPGTCAANMTPSSFISLSRRTQARSPFALDASRQKSFPIATVAELPAQEAPGKQGAGSGPTPCDSGPPPGAGRPGRQRRARVGVEGLGLAPGSSCLIGAPGSPRFPGGGRGGRPAVPPNPGSAKESGEPEGIPSPWGPGHPARQERCPGRAPFSPARWARSSRPGPSPGPRAVPAPRVPPTPPGARPPAPRADPRPAPLITLL